MEQIQATSEVSAAKIGNTDDHVYDAYLKRVADRFELMTKRGGEPLFTTDAEGLWEAYLSGFEPDQRQFHLCHACRHFIQHFGGLVVISEGVTGAAIWSESDAPELYMPAVAAMARIVRRSKVTGVFLSSLPVWGHPETGPWRHFAIHPFKSQRFTHSIKSAHQAMASKHEDFGTVSRALAEFTPAMVDQALTLLKSDALYRSEKVLGQAQWLHDLHTARAAVRKDQRDNVLWRQIATAPDGFCHPRASMIGTLLEDIAAGLDFGEVSRKFRAKMAPGFYQRPQAAPTAGNIAQGEKLIEQLGLAPSLPRRFARLDDVAEAVWRPTVPEQKASGPGVFAHLTPKQESKAVPALNIPMQVTTWEKFLRVVVPDAKTIEIYVPSLGSFCSLVTAADPEAPSLLQWDRPERRNPVSWYLYNGGSNAARWGLTANTWRRLSSITLKPSQWFGGGFEHQGEGAIFLIDGAKDTSSASGCLFPEILRAELREVRATIEAYSARATLSGAGDASAAGYMIAKGQPCDVRLRVASAAGSKAEYKIDRFD